MYGMYWRSELKLAAHIWELLFMSRRPRRAQPPRDGRTPGTSAGNEPSIRRRLWGREAEPVNG
jgi:hypothetical protein